MCGSSLNYKILESVLLSSALSVDMWNMLKEFVALGWQILTYVFQPGGFFFLVLKINKGQDPDRTFFTLYAQAV